MKACVERVRNLESRPSLLAVTVLTSLSDLTEFGIQRSVPEQVGALAGLASACGMDGVVCSPAEVAMLRQVHRPPFLLVTPGIRAAEDEMGDQKRTASPSAALQAGSDFLVIGRPITAAADPVAAAKKIAESLR